MKKQISYKVAFIVILSVLACFAIAFYTLGWTEPTQTPPNCPAGQPGCDAPINVGPNSQNKIGGLGVGAFSAAGVSVGSPTGTLVANGIRSQGDICTDAGGGKCLGSAEGSLESQPPKMFILNDNSQTTLYGCIHNVDLTEYCGDGDGCLIRYFFNHKIDGSDQVRAIENLIYMEEKGIFSSNNATTVSGFTRQDPGEIYWVTGDNVPSTIASPWNWAFILDYRSSAVGCGGNDSVYSNPYMFTLMSHPHVRTKIIVYDNGPGGEPQLVQSSQPADIYIYAANFEGEHEGCAFNSNMGDCLLNYGWYDTTEWSWNKCHTYVENYIESQCPQHTGIFWPSVNIGDALP